MVCVLIILRSPSRAPYRTPTAFAKRAAYPDPSPVVPSRCQCGPLTVSLRKSVFSHRITDAVTPSISKLKWVADATLRFPWPSEEAASQP